MSKLSNALQGKLNSSRKSHVKDPSKQQLDLFSSLSDRKVSSPKIIPSKPEPARSGPEMILPPPGPPPDVSAEVREVLSESGPVRPVETTSPAGDARPPLRTGIYQRPRRAAPPPPTAPRLPSGKPGKAFQGIRDWFAGVGWDRRMTSLVVALTLLVAGIAFWTARPRAGGKPGTVVNLDEVLIAPEPAADVPAPVSPAPVSAVSSAPAKPPVPVPVAGWTIPGTESMRNGEAVLVRFNNPVFVSSDKISVKGMAALKALAVKLVSLKTGARVVVTGYTDNEPLTKTTAQFKNNADIAAARAKVAVEHLSAYARANKGLAFEAQTGSPSQAPYPNDTPQNRRLNRTVTVQVIPAP